MNTRKKRKEARGLNIHEGVRPALITAGTWSRATEGDRTRLRGRQVYVRTEAQAGGWGSVSGEESNGEGEGVGRESEYRE